MHFRTTKLKIDLYNTNYNIITFKTLLLLFKNLLVVKSNLINKFITIQILKYKFKNIKIYARQM